MRKLSIIIFFIFIRFAAVEAEIVKKIEILGNKRVSSETIKIYGEISINKNYEEQDLNTVLNNLYSTNFFKEINIDLKNGILKLTLIEYPLINQLLVLGESSSRYQEQIKKLIKLKDKNSFIENNLATDVEIIKNLYSSLGFNFVKVNAKVRKIDDFNLDLIFEIDRGDETRISKIIFSGDKKVREKRLRDVIASQEHKFWKIISKNSKFSENLVRLDIRLLKNYYKSIGYYDVDITSKSAELNKNKNEIQITYSIDAGERYIIKKIITNADPVFDKNIFFSLNKEFNDVVGTYYSPFKIKDMLEDIDDLIEKNDLQFVEHNVEEVVEDEFIVVKFNIFEGEKISVERINILGNNITNESVIRGELLLDEGDPYTKLKLDKSISKIKSRGIFSDVKHVMKDGSAANLKIIDIIVEEQPTGEISAGAGVGTNGGTIAFTVKENNWLGEGKRVAFDVELNEESLRGTINYTNPNYDFLGNSLNYSLGSVSSDKPNQGYENTVFTGGIGTTFEQYKDIYARLGLNLTFDDLKTDNTASDSMKSQSGKFTELAANYGFSYDKRNRVFQPTDGNITGFDQSFPLYADKAFISNTITSSTYRTLSENVIGAGKFYVSSVNGLNDEDVRISKRKTMSNKRLRGFRNGKVGPKDGQDFIGGNYAASFNLEANLPNLLPDSTKTDIGLFFDVGNVWGVDYNDSIDDSNVLRSSFGAAASWTSPIGPMTFIISQNLSKASTDETETFNFNLGTTF